MKRLTQSIFAEPSGDELKALKDEPLIIHQRQNPTLNRYLIVFVHGLRGRRYGKNATWGYFPRFIYEDFTKFDVALFSYRTFEQRLKFGKSIKIEDEAKIFADIVRDDLKDYGSVILIGHSMGGLLCKAVIANLATTNQQEPGSRIGGLILMATPQLGSPWAQTIFKWLSKDFWALHQHGEFVTKVHSIFEDHINLDEEVEARNKTLIPGWIVYAASDFWVDKLSAGAGLPNKRKKLVRGSHSEIVKPLHQDDDVYNFVQSCIANCLARLEKMSASLRLSRKESISFLCKFTGQNDTVSADTIAKAFDDSPERLSKAASFIKDKNIPLSDYFQVLLQMQEGQPKQELIIDHVFAQ